MSQNFSGKRNTITFLLIAATLLLLVYISSNPYVSKLETIRIGIHQCTGHEHLFIAKKQGFFKQAGLDVELVELSSLTEVRRAFERGKVDGMASTLIEVLEAFKYSGKIAQPVLIIDYSNGADEILGSTKINTIKELKGKKIGVESGSLSTYLVSRALEMNDIKSSEVVIMPMELHDMPIALKTGKVDAITSYPPTSVAIKKQMGVNVLFDSSIIPNEILDVIAINKEVLAKNPELQKQLLQTWKLTLDYTRNYSEEAYNILTERLMISVNDFKQAMDHINLVGHHEQSQYFKEGLLMESLLKTGEVVFKHLEVEEIDYSQFIYNE
ncbi:MAG: ABC transporter substrate-binding protein [Gammaproteobacteria bacterium]|nr:ABC transporter substrate-binding protein [Gammaproteobacteria bacterium]